MRQPMSLPDFVCRHLPFVHDYVLLHVKVGFLSLDDRAVRVQFLVRQMPPAVRER